jgi:hypothetical protein
MITSSLKYIAMDTPGNKTSEHWHWLNALLLPDYLPCHGSGSALRLNSPIILSL